MKLTGNTVLITGVPLASVLNWPSACWNLAMKLSFADAAKRGLQKRSSSLQTSIQSNVMLQTVRSGKHCMNGL